MSTDAYFLSGTDFSGQLGNVNLSAALLKAIQTIQDFISVQYTTSINGVGSNGTPDAKG